MQEIPPARDPTCKRWTSEGSFILPTTHRAARNETMIMRGVSRSSALRSSTAGTSQIVRTVPRTNLAANTKAKYIMAAFKIDMTDSSTRGAPSEQSRLCRGSKSTTCSDAGRVGGGGLGSFIGRPILTWRERLRSRRCSPIRTTPMRTSPPTAHRVQPVSRHPLEHRAEASGRRSKSSADRARFPLRRLLATHLPVHPLPWPERRRC